MQTNATFQVEDNKYHCRNEKLPILLTKNVLELFFFAVLFFIIFFHFVYASTWSIKKIKTMYFVHTQHLNWGSIILTCDIIVK